jgi:ribonuclease HI
MVEEDFLVYTDGASRGNPGPAAAAFVFLKNNHIVFKKSFFLGNMTNNQAEYQAIIKALMKAQDFIKTKIIVFSDSELVIKQLNGEYRVTKPHLKVLKEKTMNLVKEYTNVRFEHISRQNKWIQYVDKLCNQSLDSLSDQ